MYATYGHCCRIGMNSRMASVDWLNDWSRVMEYGLVSVCVCEAVARRVKTMCFGLLTFGFSHTLYLVQSIKKFVCSS